MDDSSPDIAVMMLLYNGAEHLRQSLDTLSQQTYKNFHLFIIDDASSDESFDIAKEYEAAFSNITLKKNTANKGVINNLYDTLKLIEVESPSANYFIWACPDDWWDPQYLEVTRHALIQNPQASVCQTGFDKQNLTANYEERHQLPSIKGNVYGDVRPIFYPHATEGKNGFYNQSIHGLIRMDVLRDIYPNNAALIGHASCTELSAVAVLFLRGDIIYLEGVKFHKHIGSAFINKYPNDPLTRLYNNPLLRIKACLSHLPRFIKIRRKNISIVTALLIWGHIFYFYSVLTPLYSLKKQLRIGA